MKTVIAFANSTAEPSTYRPAPERILAGDPVQTATLHFTSADGRFSAGTWAAERGTWRVVFTESEFCHLLEGVIVVTDEAGTQTTFRAGDAFVSPAGFTGTWEIVEPARKLFAFYESPSHPGGS
ncbi:UNVERIFIED_ORG: putative cupin superfamily protein [Methylorubrum zatmanii]|jgi:uncharacterized cupin superfamily protein